MAVVVLTERSARASSSAPSTVLGAGVAAVAAFAGLMGTYTLFLLQSVVAVARDAQVRADGLVDAGRSDDAAAAMGAVSQAGHALSTGTDTIGLIGGLIVGAIIVGWLVATDHARRNSVAQAWLTAYQRVTPTSPRQRPLSGGAVCGVGADGSVRRHAWSVGRG